MSISELNHFMTYVLDGWMLFSAGFIGISFISFVSKRIQEDLEAEALAITQAEKAAVEEAEAARLEEVAAVSKRLAKSKVKDKQSDVSSVSVST